MGEGTRKIFFTFLESKFKKIGFGIQLPPPQVSLEASRGEAARII